MRATLCSVRFAVCLLSAGFCGGCNEPTGTVDVVTTTAMVGDIVKNVAGDRWAVETLMGPRSDPHDYEPTRDDIRKLRAAKYVFYSGLGLEGRMTDVFENLEQQGRSVWAVTRDLHKTYEVRHPENGHADPHVWMDVKAWSQCVSLVAESLSAAEPSAAGTYRENAQAYQRELALLDQYAWEVIATIPPQQRILVTAHDAFAYFARAYGIKVCSPQGVDTTQEASLSDINALVDLLVKDKIPVLFTEESVNDKNLSRIIEGAASRGWKVRKAEGQLFSDSMGPACTHEGTYIGMIDHNATLIARELGGKPPVGGFREWRRSK